MSAIKKYLFLILVASQTSLFAMEWFNELSHYILKYDLAYLKSHLNQDKTCQTLIDQGKTVPSERSLDEKTSELLKQFINRKRDAHKIIFDYLREGKIKEAEEFCHSVHFHLVQPLVRLFALGHIEKFKKAEREKAEEIENLIHPTTTLKTQVIQDSYPQNEPSTELALRTPSTDKSGLVHYWNKWNNPNYRIEHLEDGETIRICKGLKAQAIKPPTAPAVDYETYRDLCRFSERCLLASKTVIEFLQLSDESSLTKLKYLYARLTSKKAADIHDLFCPVIQLFALRGLIQYQKSITKGVKKIESNVMQEELATKLPEFPTGNYLDVQSLSTMLAERETEYTTLRDALLEKMNPPRKVPMRPPSPLTIRKENTPPLLPPAHNTDTPSEVPRDTSPKNISLAESTSSPLPTPPTLPKNNDNAKKDTESSTDAVITDEYIKKEQAKITKKLKQLQLIPEPDKKS